MDEGSDSTPEFMDTGSNKEQRKRLFLLGLLALALVGVLAALALGMDLKGLVREASLSLAAAGPLAFFTALALLPAFGMPVMPFYLMVGPVFGQRLGMPLALVCALGAMLINMALTYWLARWALRPQMEQLMRKLGYRLPEVNGSDATDLVVVLRVTPGIPFFVQNYLSGLAEVPVRTYLLVSLLAQGFYGTAFVLFGEALVQGKGRVLLLAVGLLAATLAGTHYLRRHYAARKARAGS